LGQVLLKLKPVEGGQRLYAPYGTIPTIILGVSKSHHGDWPLDGVVFWSPMSPAFRFDTPLRSSWVHHGVNAAPSCGAQILHISGLQSATEGATRSEFKGCCNLTTRSFG